MKLSPVVIFAYNRLDHLEKTIEAISKNRLADESQFYVFQDGPRKKDLTDNSYERVTEYCKNLNLGKTCTFIKRDNNYGLFKSVITGVTETLEKHNSVIVLEDDLITSPSFLQYMNESLNYYENNSQVGTINGYSYNMDKNLPNYYFLRGANPYGWGTWKNRWSLLETDTTILKKKLTSRKLVKEWDYANGISMLEAQEQGEISSWLICWHTSLFLSGKLTLFPSHSYVYHNGFDESATHCINGEKLDIHQFKVKDLNTSFHVEDIKKIRIEEIKTVREIIQYFYHTINGVPYTSPEKLISKYYLLKHNIKQMLFTK